MRRLKKVREEEMILSFLLSEYYSPRFSIRIQQALKKKRISKNIILKPDLRSAKQNVQRKCLLGVARGYGEDRLLFEGFPAGVKWFRSMATQKDIQNFWFMNHEIWRKLSGDSRRVRDIKPRSIAQSGGETERHIRSIRYSLLHAEHYSGTILVVSSSVNSSKRMILEGHARAAALSLLDGKYFPVEVLWGISPRISKMKYW